MPPAPPPAVTPDLLRVARTLPVTEAEGPGRRAAVWVQGCSLRCPGCFNPHLWTTRGGKERMVDDLAAELVDRAVTDGVEGVTLLGGEPFDQAAPLARLAAAFHRAGLTVMTFTGYDIADLREWAANRPDIEALLASTDLLADGPYLEAAPERARPWIGSANQGLHSLTDRYPHPAGRDSLEVRVAADGTVAVNGWADVAALEDLLDGLRRPPWAQGPLAL
ncbi:4Fe-4S single cluster domain-containing protein [Blastococcus sp. TF02A-26]|uniref:4Fe-4S single cluster domain-containing protein n=1 Tax=Blastococcus sp. TF02A-26 TaxID=2250577 RepID=UPI000DE8004B|nr:4Fe-4S single cluster domain-containing protein [Blastococcus sp. TF02A-26]RBY84316.1 hypothetical protein DQ240_14405 [Blastococcus sp. TF02A-26]